MIIITGYVRIRADALATIKPAMGKILTASRAEAGCINYDYSVDVEDEGRIFIQEKWKSWADLEQHMKQPHIAPWRAAMQEAGVHDRNLRAWEVQDEGKEL